MCVQTQTTDFQVSAVDLQWVGNSVDQNRLKGLLSHLLMGPRVVLRQGIWVEAELLLSLRVLLLVQGPHCESHGTSEVSIKNCTHFSASTVINPLPVLLYMPLSHPPHQIILKGISETILYLKI